MLEVAGENRNIPPVFGRITITQTVPCLSSRTHRLVDTRPPPAPRVAIDQIVVN